MHQPDMLLVASIKDHNRTFNLEQSACLSQAAKTYRRGYLHFERRRRLYMISYLNHLNKIADTAAYRGFYFYREYLEPVIPPQPFDAMAADGNLFRLLRARILNRQTSHNDDTAKHATLGRFINQSQLETNTFTTLYFNPAGWKLNRVPRVFGLIELFESMNRYARDSKLRKIMITNKMFNFVKFPSKYAGVMLAWENHTQMPGFVRSGFGAYPRLEDVLPAQLKETSTELYQNLRLAKTKLTLKYLNPQHKISLEDPLPFPSLVPHDDSFFKDKNVANEGVVVVEKPQLISFTRAAKSLKPKIHAHSLVTSSRIVGALRWYSSDGKPRSIISICSQFFFSTQDSFIVRVPADPLTAEEVERDNREISNLISPICFPTSNKYNIPNVKSRHLQPLTPWTPYGARMIGLSSGRYGGDYEVTEIPYGPSRMEHGYQVAQVLYNSYKPPSTEDWLDHRMDPIKGPDICGVIDMSTKITLTYSFSYMAGLADTRLNVCEPDLEDGSIIPAGFRFLLAFVSPQQTELTRLMYDFSILPAYNHFLINEIGLHRTREARSYFHQYNFLHQFQKNLEPLQVMFCNQELSDEDMLFEKPDRIRQNFGFWQGAVLAVKDGRVSPMQVDNHLYEPLLDTRIWSVLKRVIKQSLLQRFLASSRRIYLSRTVSFIQDSLRQFQKSFASNSYFSNVKSLWPAFVKAFPKSPLSESFFEALVSAVCKITGISVAGVAQPAIGFWKRQQLHNKEMGSTDWYGTEYPYKKHIKQLRRQFAGNLIWQERPKFLIAQTYPLKAISDRLPPPPKSKKKQLSEIEAALEELAVELEDVHSPSIDGKVAALKKAAKKVAALKKAGKEVEVPETEEAGKEVKVPEISEVDKNVNTLEVEKVATAIRTEKTIKDTQAPKINKVAKDSKAIEADKAFKAAEIAKKTKDVIADKKAKASNENWQFGKQRIKEKKEKARLNALKKISEDPA